MKVSLLVFGCSVAVMLVIELFRYWSAHYHSVNQSADDNYNFSSSKSGAFNSLEMSERSITSSKSGFDCEDDVEEGEEGEVLEHDQKRRAALRKQRRIKSRNRKSEDAGDAAEDCCQTLLSVWFR
jgi:hypothetical protein